MGRRDDRSQSEWVEEAARLICDEGYTDYRLARAKAAERLGLRARGGGPEPSRIEAAVIARQELFGGEAYHAHLRAMRQTAVRVMKLLERFDPRLAGGAVSGAVGNRHRVQIHVVSDRPESVEIFLLDRQIDVEQDERRYRLADGRDSLISLCRFDADDIGVEVAIFEPGSERHPPLSAVDGKPSKRLTIEQVQALL
ncbi:MAG TPA: hypothetical protein VJM11_12290 [Nevskiaceae bacterium]|nr:hypothetical protein [Nevskiaceae bacterium]